MEKFQMKALVLGMIETNCYVICNRVTGEAIVVDPGDEAGKILQYLSSNNLVLKAILLTHGHFDHILAAPELAGATGANIYAHENEIVLLTDAKLNASSHIRKTCELNPDVVLKGEELLELAGFTIKVIHTPGHTGGGVCYLFTDNGVLFSGDTLFLEDIGRSDLPTGDGKQLVESIVKKLMPMEDKIAVYPGHGSPTTIGHERKYNAYIS